MQIGFGTAYGDSANYKLLGSYIDSINSNLASSFQSIISESVNKIIFELLISGKVEDYHLSGPQNPKYSKKKKTYRIQIGLCKVDIRDKSIKQILDVLSNYTEKAAQAIQGHADKNDFDISIDIDLLKSHIFG